MKFLLVTLCGLVMGVSAVEAQNGGFRPSQGVTILGGAFLDERGEGGHHPFVSARYERWLSRWVAFEGGVTHARSERLLVSQVSPESHSVATPYTSLDLGIHLQLPLPLVRPYVGATIGGTYFDGSNYRGSEVGITHAVMAGARVGHFRNISLRGEFRLRRDNIANVVGFNGEYGLGLTYNF